MLKNNEIILFIFRSAILMTEMSQYTKGRRRPKDHFDGGVIVTEQQQGTNVLIRYPELKVKRSKMNRIQRKWEVFPGMQIKI